MNPQDLLEPSRLYKLGLKDQWVCFDVFFRKVPESGGYVIAAGLDSIISYIKGINNNESIQYDNCCNAGDIVKCNDLNQIISM